MKKAISFSLFFFLFINIVRAQVITCQTVAVNVGRSVTICGEVKGILVDSAEQKIPTLFFLCAQYPNQPITIVIPNKTLLKFTSPPGLWLGKQICVTGTITTYKGNPEIMVSNKSQVVVH